MEIMGGIIGIVLFVCGLILAIAWVVFPFMVINRMDKLVKQQDAIEYQLQQAVWQLQKISGAN
jgi:hypothetical protein